MDIHAIVGLNTVDGLQLCASVGISQLIVGTAADNRALDIGTLEGAASDGNHGASAVLGVVDGESAVECNLQLKGEFQFWSRHRLGLLSLCAGTQCEHGQQQGK